MKNFKILLTITCAGILFLLAGLKNTHAQSCSSPLDCDDSNICTTDLCVSNVCYNQPAVLSTWNTTNVSCNGGSDGAIDLMPGGTSTPYTYLWSNTATTQDISGLSAGVYGYTITDVYSCTFTGSIGVNEPSALSLSLYVTDTGCDGINAIIGTNISGGTPNYTYAWSVPGSLSTPAVTVNSSSSPYSVTITDANGCTITKSVMVYEDCCVEEITHCADVTDPTTSLKAVTIYAGGSGCTPTVDVSDDGVLLLEGGSEVYLRDGFYAHPSSGGEFHAYIVPCTTGSPKRGEEETAVEAISGISVSAYPNPFHNSVMFKYHLSKTEVVNMYLTDLTGREIAHVLNNTVTEPGDYSLELQTGSFADGIYLCVFKAGSFRQTQKLIKIVSE